MEGMMIFLIYMAVIFGIVGGAALLGVLADHVPVFGRFVEWLIERTLL